MLTDGDKIIDPLLDIDILRVTGGERLRDRLVE